MKHIGYIPMKDGKPQINNLIGRAKKENKPVTIHQYAWQAQEQSVDDECKAVFMKEE